MSDIKQPSQVEEHSTLSGIVSVQSLQIQGSDFPVIMGVISMTVRAGGSTPTADATTPESRQARYNELGGLEGIYNLVKDGPEGDKEKFVDMVQDF